MKCIYFFLLFGCLAVCACNNNNSRTNNKSLANNAIAGNFSSQQTIRFDASAIPAFLKKYPLLEDTRPQLDSFYKNRQYAFAWFDENGPIEQASNLYIHINDSTNGLVAKLPYQTVLAKMMGSDGADSADFETELMLSAQYFLYAKSVWSGLPVAETKRIDWFIPRKKIAAEKLLDSLLNGKDVLDAPPVYRQYALLKKELQRYKNLQKNGGFPMLVWDKTMLSMGDTSQAILALRRWVALSGNRMLDTTTATYDAGLLPIIKGLQQRFGLAVDGVIRPDLIQEMNLPIETRMQQIMVNMERSRWVPVHNATDYLVVNIPEYKLHVYEHDSLLWSMDAVVGQPAHKTVIFMGKIGSVVFSPYWNVPPGIMKNEVQPGIRRNKHYLANHDMEWNGGQVRQRPGNRNPLGLVKFLFPNSYDIYLHDTPSKSLFGKNNRAFSHGCIRLSDAEKLADYLLVDDTEWPPANINAAMHAGKEHAISLKKSESVFIVYFTAWVDGQGQLNFRKDIYGRDKSLAKMLLANAVL